MHLMKYRWPDFVLLKFIFPNFELLNYSWHQWSQFIYTSHNFGLLHWYKQLTRLLPQITGDAMLACWITADTALLYQVRPLMPYLIDRPPIESVEVFGWVHTSVRPAVDSIEIVEDWKAGTRLPIAERGVCKGSAIHFNQAKVILSNETLHSWRCEHPRQIRGTRGPLTRL